MIWKPDFPWSVYPKTAGWREDNGGIFAAHAGWKGRAEMLHSYQRFTIWLYLDYGF